jgi:hypothetical protein
MSSRKVPKLTMRQKDALIAFQNGGELWGSWFPFARIRKHGIVLCTVRCSVIDKLEEMGLLQKSVAAATPSMRLTRAGVLWQEKTNARES